MKEIDEVSLLELMLTLWKNKVIIITFMIGGMLLGVAVTKVQAYQNPPTFRYQAISTIELADGFDKRNQAQTLLLLLESKPLIENSKENLKISKGEYLIQTRKAAENNQYDIIVEGPDQNLAVSLVNEIVKQGRSIARRSLSLRQNQVVEMGYVFGDPIPTSKTISYSLNINLFMIFGCLISILWIFGVRNFGGKIHSKGEVERILNVKVLGSFPPTGKHNFIRTLFKVR